MKKVFLFMALVATLGFASCTNKQAEAEKTGLDSIAEVAVSDSVATTVDTLVETVEEEVVVE